MFFIGDLFCDNGHISHADLRMRQSFPLHLEVPGVRGHIRIKLIQNATLYSIY